MDSRIQDLISDLESEIEDVRKMAVVTLAQRNDPSLLPHLEKMMQDPSPAVQYFARRSVDELRKKLPRPAATPPVNSVPELVRALCGEDINRRMAAATECCQVKDPQLLTALLDALARERDLRVIATLVRALGTYRDPRITQKILQLLHHSDARVRANTVDVAMDQDDPEVIDAVALMAGDAANRVRGSVALFLANRDPHRVQTIVRQMVASDMLWMKDTAVYVMHIVGADWCQPILENLAARADEDPTLVEEARLALRQLQARASIDAARSGSPGIPRANGASAESIPKPAGGSRPAFPPAPAENDVKAPLPDLPVAKDVSAAGSGPAQSKKESCLDALNGPDVEARLTSLEYLAKFDDDEGVLERIHLAAGDVDSRVRERARAAVKEIEVRQQQRPQLLLLGNRVFKALTSQEVACERLQPHLDQVAAVSARIDRGQRMADAAASRDRELVQLGRAALDLFQAGTLTGTTLDPDFRRTQKLIDEMQQTAAPAEIPAPDPAPPSDPRGVSGSSGGESRRGNLSQSTPSKSLSVTRREKFVPVSPQQNTLRMKVPPIPSVGLAQRLHEYRLLLFPLVAVFACALIVFVGMSTHTNTYGHKAPPKISAGSKAALGFAPDDVMKAWNPVSYVGKLVRWGGQVKEIDSAHQHIVVKYPGGAEYSADFKNPVDRRIGENTQIMVDGTIQVASAKSVSVAGVHAYGMNVGRWGGSR